MLGNLVFKFFSLQLRHRDVLKKKDPGNEIGEGFLNQSHFQLSNNQLETAQCSFYQIKKSMHWLHVWCTTLKHELEKQNETLMIQNHINHITAPK